MSTSTIHTEKTSAAWSPWRTSNYYYFEQHLTALPATNRLIDLGAGDLQFEKLFTRFVYTGVDFQKFPHISVVTDLTKTIPLPAESADIITLSNTVEHIPNTEHLFAECKRLLKPGGIIIGTVPFLVQVHQAPYDFNRYTDYQLRRFLEIAGFRNIEVVPLGSLIDAYDSMELKFFDHLKSKKRSFIVTLVNKARRFIMKKILRPLANGVSSNATYTEGYGFRAEV